VETLTTADGAAVQLADGDVQFAAAMAAPRSDDPEAAPPPRIDPDAPYGRKADGSPRRSAGGRRAVKPRLTDAAEPAAPRPQAASAAPAAAGAADYRGKVAEFADGAWMVCAAMPIPSDGMRLRVRAQAALIKANRDQLSAGIGIMAEHSPPVRRAVDFMTGGSAGWILPAILAVSPFAVQSAALWRIDDQADDQADAAAGMKRLADRTEREWGELFSEFKADLEAEAGLADAAADDPL
jgi:hypothetical protein